jgi:hypothetical protein
MIGDIVKKYVIRNGSPKCYNESVFYKEIVGIVKTQNKFKDAFTNEWDDDDDSDENENTIMLIVIRDSCTGHLSFFDKKKFIQKYKAYALSKGLA